MSERFDGMSHVNERAIVTVLKSVAPALTIEHVTDLHHPALEAAGLDFTQSIPMKDDEILRYVVTDHVRPSAAPIKRLVENAGTWCWMFESGLGTKSMTSLFACIYERDLGRKLGRVHDVLGDVSGEGFMVAATFSKGHILIIQSLLLKTIIGKGKI